MRNFWAIGTGVRLPRAVMGVGDRRYYCIERSVHSSWSQLPTRSPAVGLGMPGLS
jgi:hypothetical protein